MQINKAELSGKGENLRIGVPFSKVDIESRIVSGFATTDALDRRSDLVLASASEKAFSRFRGNIREMHAPNAVGKMVHFSPEEIFDPETGQFYNGVFVRCYVSKGAPDTWEKVLDGTLSGFSIGGEIIEAEPFNDPETGETIRIIKDYELVELSLVDAPCNQLSNVLSVVKADGVSSITGMAVETKASNVFWCKEEKIAKVSDEESLDCACGEAMQVIGWIESSDMDKALAVREVVNKFLGPVEPSTENSEGGNKVTKKEEVVAEETVEETVETPEAVEAEATASDEDNVMEKAAEVSEVEVVEEAEPSTPDLGAFMDEVKSLIKTTLASRDDEASAAFSEISKSVETLEQKVSELTEKFGSTVGNVEKSVEDLKTTVEKIDKSTAIKKSDDLGGSEASNTEDVWGGSFLSVESLN
jgi:hypothetical protein